MTSTSNPTKRHASPEIRGLTIQCVEAKRQCRTSSQGNHVPSLASQQNRKIDKPSSNIGLVIPSDSESDDSSDNDASEAYYENGRKYAYPTIDFDTIDEIAQRCIIDPDKQNRKSNFDFYSSFRSIYN